VLAYFVHVISPNKYIGYFAFIAFVIANQFVWRPLHVATRLVQFASQPDTTYSDFFGFAPYWKSWTVVYGSTGWPFADCSPWPAFCCGSAAASMRGSCVCGTPACVSRRLSRAGFRPADRSSWERARGSITTPKVLNTILSEDDRDRLSVDYEKTYKKYDKLPQPRIIDLKYAIDLYPERRAATMRADTIIQNKTASRSPCLHLNYADPDYRTEVQIDGAKLKQDDQRLQYRIYEFRSAHAAGRKASLAVHRHAGAARV
jgi:ABC-2 type transport system permease protein